MAAGGTDSGQTKKPADGPTGPGVRWHDCQVSSRGTTWGSLNTPVGFRNKAVLGDRAGPTQGQGGRDHISISEGVRGHRAGTPQDVRLKAAGGGVGDDSPLKREPRGVYTVYTRRPRSPRPRFPLARGALFDVHGGVVLQLTLGRPRHSAGEQHTLEPNHRGLDPSRQACQLGPWPCRPWHHRAGQSRVL